MIAVRRRTRETLRHERAVVLQELAAPTAAQVRQDIAANKFRAAELRRAASGKGGEPDGRDTAVRGPEPRRTRVLGLVADKPVAGGNGTGSPEAPCKYCGIVGGHTADCPVIS